MTNLYGLLGFPLGHSFSKTYFTEKFKTENMDAEFRNFELRDITRMLTLIDETPSLKGFAITIPYKEKIIPFLHHISAEAKAIGAVNAVKIDRTNAQTLLSGYNTDVLGFKESLLPFLPTNHPRQALLLGTGGASKAVKYALQSIGIDVITVSRTPDNEQEIGYNDVVSYIDNSRLIVNATPLGMWPNVRNAPDIPYEHLTTDHYLFDLVYNPETTEFMKRGTQHGAHVRNGLQMLYLQADHSWQIWNKE